MRSTGSRRHTLGDVRSPLLLFAFTCAHACGDDSAATPSPRDLGPADAGIPGSDDAGPPGSRPPASPALPNLLPCPPGWREVAPDGEAAPATCDPRPSTAAPSCAGDEIWVPGMSFCERVGTACPEGDWPDGVPDGARVFYVRPDGGAGADGTRSAPFGLIADALVAARDGDIVALAKGAYAETLVVRRSITLWGACPAETRIAAPARSSPSDTLTSAVVLVGGRATIRNLTVGGLRQGIEVAGPATVRIEGVVVAGASLLGVLAYTGAQVSADRLVVRDTAAGADAQQGWGVWADEGATIELTRTASIANRDTALVASGRGSALRVSDAWIAATLPGGGTGRGDGIAVGRGASATVERTLVETSSFAGIGLDGTGTVRDVLVADTAARPVPGRGWGSGIFVRLGADVTIERTHVSGTRGLALGFHGAGVASLADVVVSDTATESFAHTIGAALAVGDGSVVDIARAYFAGGLGIGAQVFGEGVLRASDLTVRDTGAVESNGAGGRGIEVFLDATAELDRVAILGGLEVGLDCQGAHTRVTARDLRVADIAMGECWDPMQCLPIGGIGVGVYDGASLELERFHVERPSLVGVHVAREGSIRASDGLVRETIVGASVSLAQDETDRFRSAVRFEATEVELDARVIDVPEPLETLRE
ncbi:MAG: hypothetical protein IT379_03775 [Deltaproteobacteria bacterium]|nr:hypothetical protein [Deltaproteobacteria bacterium]